MSSTVTPAIRKEEGLPPPGSDDNSYLSSEEDEVEVMGYNRDDTYRGPGDSNDELSANYSEDSDDDNCSNEDFIKIACVVPSPKKRAAMPKRAVLKEKLAVLICKATWTRKARVCKPTSPTTKKRSVTEVSELVLIQAPPPSRKPRDTLLRSCFTSEAVAHGKEKHTCNSCDKFVSCLVF